MLSERTIINALILAAGLIVGPYLTIATFSHNYWPILTFGGVTFLLVVFFFVGDRMCTLPLLGICFGGGLNFLPMGLTAGDLCIFITILYYLVTYVALKQKSLKTGPSALFYPIVIIGLIMLYHQRSFGIHAFGGTKEGSRPAVLILAAVTCYFCGINIVNPPITFLRRLPWYCLALQLVSSLPYIITTYAPQSANSLIYLSNDVNLSAYGGEDIVREGAQASIAAGLQGVLLAYFPIYTWWRPERWWVAILSLICFWMVAHGGFRSGLLMYGFGFMMGAWCYWSWRALLLVPPFVLLLLCLGLAQSSNLISLPLSVQRSLSFLPGKWDPEVVGSASSSDEFRQAIERVYKQEYLDKSPWLGNGMAFDINEYNTVIDKSRHDTSDGYWGTKIFIVGKEFHIGWISVYDCVGIIGTAAFVMLGVIITYYLGCFIVKHRSERRSPLLPLRVWMFCGVSSNMFGYFTVYGNFAATFIELCVYAIILAHLLEIERRPETQAARIPDHELFGLPKLGSALLSSPTGGSGRQD